MTTFDEREKAQEKKFEHDQELAFKAKARRNHLFGLWTAAQLGLSGAAAETYARGLVADDFTKGSEEALLAKVAADLKAKGLPHEHGRLRVEFERCLAEAKKQFGIPR
jgi:hypothetical protein